MKNYSIDKLFNFFEYWKRFTNPTEFYNEWWLTRLFIQAVNDHEIKNHDLFIGSSEKYFSEALLTSPFLAKKKSEIGQKDSLAEEHTHADGAIGHFTIGDENRKGLLKMTANKLTIIEAKIASEFSPKVTNASFYNQAARYIACIAQTVKENDKIEEFDRLDLKFRLLIPSNQYKRKKRYKEFMQKEHIKKIVERRVEQYVDRNDYKEKKKWFDNIFLKVLDKIDINEIFYEDMLKDLKDYKYHSKLEDFYKKCCEYNGLKP